MSRSFPPMFSSRNYMVSGFTFGYTARHAQSSFPAAAAGIKSIPPAEAVWSLNHWTAREIPQVLHWNLIHFELFFAYV